MPPRLRIERDAGHDISEAALWYEDRRPGLGLEFLEQIDLIFERIAQSPFQFPRIEGNTRRALLGRFPYGIYFEVEEDRVAIQAVLHLHRHPDSWKDRIG
jgi:plasmid stabilization system protein ParE